MTTPVMAVVGHPNKGKSSIVATLAENTHVQISAVPGTTRSADHHQLRINNQPLYDLIDTPGFQRAGKVCNWLKAHEADASSRPDLVRQFVSIHENDPKYADECALLQPIIDGAGIIYVVDGSKPYGPEYEFEMEILRWTGQPRMALINMIGQADYRSAWRQGLGQYFSIVREFNAHKASFDARIALLQGFSEIEESWRAPLQQATRLLREERERQTQQSAEVITQMLISALSAHAQTNISDTTPTEAIERQLRDRLMSSIRRLENRARHEVQRVYRHSDTNFSVSELNVLNTDLFAESSWQLFGLSKMQLLAAGAVSGALAGGTLDLLVGGASMFTGSVLGSAVGSLSVWFAGPELARIKVLGAPLGGKIATLGPITTANFPWVLLGRAALHHALVCERNHGVRSEVVDQLDTDDHFFDFLESTARARIELCFATVRKGKTSRNEELASLIQSLLQTQSNLTSTST
ncbi:MAG: GTPase/DUF3482 domain-containing protein [Pseudomonadota bacterium]